MTAAIMSHHRSGHKVTTTMLMKTTTITMTIIIAKMNTMETSLPSIQIESLSEGSGIYSKQLEKYNTSNLYRATPPQCKSLIKHSSSARPEKPARKQERGEEEEKSYDEFVINSKKSSSNKLNKRWFRNY